jgi:hypothetical protein
MGCINAKPASHPAALPHLLGQEEQAAVDLEKANSKQSQLTNPLEMAYPEEDDQKVAVTFGATDTEQRVRRYFQKMNLTKSHRIPTYQKMDGNTDETEMEIFDVGGIPHTHAPSQMYEPVVTQEKKHSCKLCCVVLLGFVVFLGVLVAILAAMGVQSDPENSVTPEQMAVPKPVRIFKNVDAPSALMLAPPSYPTALQGVTWVDEMGFYGYSNIPGDHMGALQAFGDPTLPLDTASRHISLNLTGPNWVRSNSAKTYPDFAEERAVEWTYSFQWNEDYTRAKILTCYSGECMGTKAARGKPVRMVYEIE